LQCRNLAADISHSASSTHQAFKMLPLGRKTLPVLLVLVYCKGGWGDGNEEEAVALLPVLPLLDEEASGLILQDTDDEVGVSEGSGVDLDVSNVENGETEAELEDSLLENEEAESEPEPEPEPEPESEPENDFEVDQGSLTTPEPGVIEEEADTEEAEEPIILLPMFPLIELEEEPACLDSEFGCCQNSSWPAHGPSEEGCCLNSTEGCCPDFIRPREEGCDCSESAFGCCLDGITTKLGEGADSGCGCKESEHGCCQDQYTSALGPDLEGCPCGTSEYGCCEDGKTVAEGPNGEGCLGCQASEHGCCPDNFTPASGPDSEGCGCSGSTYGCCPDGLTEATGEDFEGCEERPGEACHLSKDGGLGENFTVLWFFDIKEGRCSRFWYGGEGGNKNAFSTSEECEEICVSPPGSAMCYLPRAEGICTGQTTMWHYDQKYKQCNSFKYGGCLGNANRFKGREECEQTCVQTASLSVCEQPLDPGPCRGNNPRWYYDDQLGSCRNFTYGGCQGNKNRFMTEDACQNSCGHQAQLKEATRICKQELDQGVCNGTEARWHFDEEARACVPFYFSGCAGNQNNFATRSECQRTCPNAFPPELEIVYKILNIEEGSEAMLRIEASGNPFPDISWQHADIEVVLDDRVLLEQDKSLKIVRVESSDSGIWTVTANNGLGQVVRRQLSLTVYPSSIPITVLVPEVKTTYDSGEEIRIGCQVEGYPVPSVRWMKNNAKLPKSQRIFVEEGNTLVIKSASPIDGGLYSCVALNKNERKSEVVELSVEKGEIPDECTDLPGLANCDLVVKRQQCGRSTDLQRICCKSCHEAGQTAGLPSK